MGETKITKLALSVGDKEIELNLDEVKELKRILNDIFPQKEIQFVPYYPYYPYGPCQPYYIWWGSSSGDTYCLTTGDNTSNPQISYTA